MMQTKEYIRELVELLAIDNSPRKTKFLPYPLPVCP
jgi:hypothetical protein